MVIDEGVVELLARAVHEHYLAEQVRDGAALGTRPTMVPWDDLDDDARESSRAQARDIEAKLRSIGCTVASSASDRGDGFSFTPDEVETLARREHERWMAQRTAAGWVRGDARDDARRRHPDLVAWEELDEGARDKDRDAVRHIPGVLGAAGLRVVRAA